MTSDPRRLRGLKGVPGATGEPPACGCVAFTLPDPNCRIVIPENPNAETRGAHLPWLSLRESGEETTTEFAAPALVNRGAGSLLWAFQAAFRKVFRRRSPISPGRVRVVRSRLPASPR